jgi:hypothetical protein
LLAVIALDSCESCKGRKQVVFTGVVLDAFDAPLSGASVQIGKDKAKTDERGYFKLSADSAKSYLFQARKSEFGTYSRLFPKSERDVTIKLFAATVKSFDPSQPIQLTDGNSRRRPGPAASRANWSGGGFSNMPFVYENGKLVDFGFSPSLKTSFDYVKQRKQAGPGISISIPANVLVSASGSKPSGNVNVSLSTIDIFSPGAMPGDFTIMGPRGLRDGFMISMGAGSIEIYDDRNTYQLADKATANIVIPIDTSALIFNGNIPESIPLFYYNDSTGYWQEEPEAAKINAERTAYVGTLRHFSTFNMDFKVSDPSCVQIRHNSVGVSTLPQYIVETILTFNGSVIHTERTVSDPGPNSGTWPSVDPAPCLQNTNNTSVHMLFNLPQNTEVGMVFYNATAPTVPIGMAVTTTGPTYGTTVPTCPAATCPGSCASNCNDTSCGGYGTCQFVPFSTVSTNIVLASRKIGSDLKLKWVHNATGTHTYVVKEIDPLDNPIADVCTITADARTALGDLIINECTLTPAAGDHNYAVFISTTKESNTVTETFP